MRAPSNLLTIASIALLSACLDVDVDPIPPSDDQSTIAAQESVRVCAMKREWICQDLKDTLEEQALQYVSDPTALVAAVANNQPIDSVNFSDGFTVISVETERIGTNLEVISVVFDDIPGTTTPVGAFRGFIPCDCIVSETEENQPIDAGGDDVDAACGELDSHSEVEAEAFDTNEI